MALKRKIIISFLIVNFFLGALIAQNKNLEENPKVFKHNLGVGFGLTTGWGLSYRFLPSKFGVQANFGPYYSDNLKQFSAGITFLLKLIDEGKTNFFLYQGNHYYFNRSYNMIYYANGVSQKTGHYDTKYFNNGLGVGIEFVILKRVGINIMSGFAAYNNFKKFSLTGETALYYKF